MVDGVGGGVGFVKMLPKAGTDGACGGDDALGRTCVVALVSCGAAELSGREAGPPDVRRASTLILVLEASVGLSEMAGTCVSTLR